MMRDLGLLLVRLTTGGLMAGHGAQKLFGWFGGHGIEGTGGWLESIGMRPGKQWALVAGGSEFGSGVLTALGLLSPLGPIGMLAPMATAAGTVHKGKPIWATEGGAELPLTNLAVGLGLTFAGPGRYSLDRALGIRVPPALALLAMVGVAAGVALSLKQAAPATESLPAGADGAEPQAGGNGAEPEPDVTRDRVTEASWESFPASDAPGWRGHA